MSRRTTHALYAGDGTHLADLADDWVEATRLRPGDAEEQPQTWREWELELVHGGPELFEPAEPLLLAAGARPAGHSSKLARALGGASKAGAALEGQAAPVKLQAGTKAPAGAV